MFLEAVAKTGHEKTSSDGDIKMHRGHVVRGSEPVSEGCEPFLGHPSHRLSKVPQAGVGGQAVHSFPPLPCDNLGRGCIELNEHGRSCATSACLCLLLSGLSHRFKSGYDFAENPYP